MPAEPQTIKSNEGELTPLQFDIMRTAITKAKQYQTRTVKELKTRLLALYPDKAEDIDAALAYWGNYERKKLQRELAHA